MAESDKNSEKLSTTPSDQGSSGCDNDVDLSSDAKGKSDDVISVAGSTSLTIDSLEEEDSKEQRCFELPITSILQSEMLKISNGKDSSSLHKHRERSATDGCKKHQVSEMIVTRNIQSSESGNDNKGGDQRSADKQKTKCGNESEKNVRQSEGKQTTANKREQTETKSSPGTLEGSGTTSKEPQTGNPNSSNAEPSGNPNSSKTESTACCAKPHEPRHNVFDAPDAHDEKLTLRKSRSLTDETSMDPASPKASRRSGIPRRKTSTHSMVTVVSSGGSTPQNDSPACVHRSMTLDSAGDPHHHHHHATLPVGIPGSTPGSTTRNAPSSSSSFPTSPVKGAGKLRRSASQCECSSVASGVSCPPLALSRDNITSRLRFEKHHQDHGSGEIDHIPGAHYLTPTQRKDMAVRELRAQVNELTQQLDEKEKQIDDLRRRVDKEKLQTDQDLQDELEMARSSAEAARKEVTSLQESHTQSVKKMATLQQQLEDVRKDMRSKLAESEDIFLEMYNKGRQSAIFEHDEEMEIKRKGGRSQESTEKELYNKLVRTQAELAKWQTIQRHESFHAMPVPGTEAETTLRFLKDSVFHFLTTDKNSSDEHLRAIVRILHFSEVQREKIAQAIIIKRNKSGW